MLPQDFLGMNVRKDNAAEHCQDGRIQFHDVEMENQHSKGKEESMHVLKEKNQNYLSTFPILRCQGKDKERGEWSGRKTLGRAEQVHPIRLRLLFRCKFAASSLLLYFTSLLFVLKNLADTVQQLDLLHVTF
jgi:hypothetical protein